MMNGLRDVAQLGSAPRSGRGSRRFKSSHPDFLLTAMVCLSQSIVFSLLWSWGKTIVSFCLP